MKHIACLLSLGLSSCITLMPVPQQPLTELPDAKPSRQLDLFYPGEAQPLQPYVALYQLDLMAEGSLPDKTLVQRISQQARQLGLDGVLIQQTGGFQQEAYTLGDALMTLSDALDPDISEVGDYQSVQTYSTISGLGIKYQSRFSHFDRAVKHEQVFRPGEGYGESQAWQLIGEIKRTPRGTVQGYWGQQVKDSIIIAEQILALSEFHLLHETDNWFQALNPEGKVYQRRLYRLQDWELKRINLLYNNWGRIKLIRIQDRAHTPPSAPAFGRIRYDFDPTGQITGRAVRQPIISSGSPHSWYEVYQYDASGRLSHKLIYPSKRKQDQALLKIEYQYYSLSELSAWLPQSAAE